MGLGFSGGVVRLFDGAVRVVDTELGSAGFGTPFGQTRSWTNLAFASPSPAAPQAGRNGSGQVIAQLPWLLKDGPIIVAVVGGLDALFFDPVQGGGYQARFFVPDRLAHDYRYSLDSAKIHALGWRRRYDFTRTLEQTVGWYSAHQDWWRTIKSGEYQEYYRRQYGPALARA
jgi:hypothetical protein